MDTEIRQTSRVRDMKTEQRGNTRKALTETKRKRRGQRQRGAGTEGQVASEMQTETRILRGYLRDRKTEMCKRRHRDQERKRNKKKYRQ